MLPPRPLRGISVLFSIVLVAYSFAAGIPTAPAFQPHNAGAAIVVPGGTSTEVSAAANVSASYTMTLTPSSPSGTLAGTPITWTASSTDPTPLVYQFSVANQNGAPQMVRDYSPKASFLWTPMVEGLYTVTVTGKEGYGAPPILKTSVLYKATHNVTTTAKVSATNNPLVALYRAPSCPAGNTILVQFRASGTVPWSSTNSQPCHPPLTRPFYVAGMLANTSYNMQSMVISGQMQTVSPVVTYTTGSIPASLTFPTVSVPQPPGPTADITDSILFHEYSSGQSNQAEPIATNLAGQVLWYANPPDLTNAIARRLEPGGYAYLDANDGQQQPSLGGNNVLREINLAGNPVRETNIAAINDQLTRLGDLPIYGFNHDYLDLPNGDVAVLAWTTKTITTTPILGDDLIVLDKNMQVSWVWDSFKFLDPFRGPTLGDTCGSTWHTVSCPVPGGPGTIDWVHINAITWSPQDSDVVLSVRNQDWVIKINYDNGAGDGSIVWRLGRDGDFAIIPANNNDPYPWFSHQHNANLLDATTLALFDNGNTRCSVLPKPCHSRGQEYLLDEATRVVTQTLSVDLGNYSGGEGTAQRLSNGDFNFTSGWLASPTGPPYAQEAEVQRSGAKVFVGQLQSVEYRAWRLPTMYSDTNLPCPTCQPGQ